MLSKFKKMSRGRQVGLIAAAVVIAALVVYVVYTNFKPEPLPEYNVSKIYQGDIQTTYETKGTVSSDNTLTYSAANGVKVKEVFVGVGDRVKKGDKLASFDTSPLSATLAQYSEAYEKSAAAYKKSVSDAEQAKQNIAVATSKMQALDGEIAQLQNDIDAAENVSAGSVDASSEESIAGGLSSGGFSQGMISDILSALTGLGSSSNLEDAILDSKTAKEFTLEQKQSQKQMLEAQISLYEMQAEGTASDIYKSVMESKKADYENYKAMVNELRNGWTAGADGIITEVNLAPGEIFLPETKTSTTTDLSSIMGLVSGDSDMSSILSDILGTVSSGNQGAGTGIVLEDSGALIADFSVGKYDLLNIKKGQKVKVSSLGNVYNGEVVYVSATATSSSSIDISTLASTFTGSASNSSNGALVKIKITNPDEKIVIGFDVDISIDTEKISGVKVLPIDAVVTEDGVNYVFTVNEDNEVTKKKITVGSYSDDYYELLEGLEIGETVIDNPKSSMADGDKISVKEVLTDK